MSATDMSRAGIEVGCLVKIVLSNLDEELYGIVIEGEREGATVAVKLPTGKVKNRGPYRLEDLERDYDDAQRARHRRLARLMGHFPDDGTAMVDDGDTLQRYALVLLAEGLSQEYSLYQFGDTFEDCVRDAGASVFDDFQPQGVFDLDTGRKVDVVVEPLVLKMSASQDVFVNELDVEPDEVIL